MVATVANAGVPVRLLYVTLLLRTPSELIDSVDPTFIPPNVDALAIGNVSTNPS